MSEQFGLFLKTVDPRFREFVSQLDSFLAQRSCKRQIKQAKSGYVVSYLLQETKRTVATYVSRKSGMRMRIYPAQLARYQDFLELLPEKMKNDIRKAPICKRLKNPNDCNLRCPMGYTFELDGERYQKCRYTAFMPALSEENNPHIRAFLDRELTCAGRLPDGKEAEQ